MDRAVLDRVRESLEKHLKDSQSSKDKDRSDTKDRVRAILKKALKALESSKDQETE